MDTICAFVLEQMSVKMPYMQLRRNSDPKEKTALRLRDTVMAFAFICLLANFYSQKTGFLYALGLILLLGMISPKLFTPLCSLWFGLAEVLGGFMSRVILFLAYLGIVSPMALLKRTHLREKFFPKNNEQTSLQFSYGEKGHTFSKDDMTKPY